MDVFGGAPRFLAYPRTLSVPLGADAVLKCQIGGDPRPEVYWERDKERLPSMGRYRLLEDGTVYNLIITRVGLEDSGQYICKAKNTIGETYAAATLRVEAIEPGNRAEPPAFLVKPASSKVVRGDSVLFSCQLSGRPEPLVTWEKDGRRLSDVFESSHFHAGRADDGWYFLKILSVRTPDAGVYVCKAQSEFGGAVGAAVLLVDPGKQPLEEGSGTRPHPHPHTSVGHAHRERKHRSHHRALQGSEVAALPVPQDGDGTRPTKVKVYSVTEGKHAKFRCYVSGKPKPEVVWRKDNVVIAPNRRHLLCEDRRGYCVLKVLYCRQQDCGLYACTASNTAGHTLSAVLLTVNESISRFPQQLVDVTVLERAVAVLECEVPAEAQAGALAWFLEDRRLFPGNKYTMECDGAVHRLTITNITADDDGVYLCETRDGSRSVAEVAVRGVIVRRLPRRVTVLVGEHAALCVELGEAELDGRWYWEGEALSESPTTIIKSFGKTHILVLVSVTLEDSGTITFVVNDSKTSTELRVKSARQNVPSCPVRARMSCERLNAASLTWAPPADCAGSEVEGYIIERQETGTEEWVQCLTTTGNTTVEILGDSVPTEADYSFRVCAANKYGQSDHLLFPGSIHLVPAVRILYPLQDVTVKETEDAEFSIELSASVLGTWHVGGEPAAQSERFQLVHARTRHSILIADTGIQDSNTEVTFLAHGVRDSAILYVTEPTVRIVNTMDDTRGEFLVGERVVLVCQLSGPVAAVTWYRDGLEVGATEDISTEVDGVHRRLVIHCAGTEHSGEYVCDAGNDSIFYDICVREPPVRIVGVAEWDRQCVVGADVVLGCELSRENAEVTWYKGEVEVEPGMTVRMEAEGVHRRLAIHSASLEDSGTYVCQAGDDETAFEVQVSEPPVKIVSVAEWERQCVVGADIVLSCELSRASAEVMWYKGEVEVEPGERVRVEAEGVHPRLAVRCATLEDSGTYVCQVGLDKTAFEVQVSEPPVRIVRVAEWARQCLVGTDLLLSCELSQANGQVSWHKGEVEVEPDERVRVEAEGVHRRLAIHSAVLEDSGTYVCQAGDDETEFEVQVSEPPVKIVSVAEWEQQCVVGADIVLSCELSRASAEVMWYKGEVEVEPGERVRVEADGAHRRLAVHCATLEDSGTYVCQAGDDQTAFEVQVSEPPVSIVRSPEIAEDRIFAASEVIAVTCLVSRPDVAVRWYKDGAELIPDSKISIESQGLSRELIIHDSEPADSGQYVCDAGTGQLTFQVTVTEPPALFTNKESKVEEVWVLQGGNAILFAIASRDTEVTWYRHREEVHDGKKYQLRTEARVHSLVVNNSAREDAGLYVCHSPDDVMMFNLTVEELPHLFTLGLDDRSVQSGETLILRCEVCTTQADVQWLKDDEEVKPSHTIVIRAEGRERSLILTAPTPADQGQYCCESKDDVTRAQVSVTERRVVEFLAELCCVTVLEGEEARFKCLLSPEDARLTWRLDGSEVPEDSSQYTVSQSGLCRTLVIRCCQPGKAIIVSAESEGLMSSATLQVQETQIVFTKKLENRTVEEMQDVTLEVGVSSECAEVRWLKQGVLVQPGNKYNVYQDGTTRKLTIHSCCFSDRGTYHCETLHDRTQARLTIESRRIMVRKPLVDMEVHEKDAVTFELELSHAAVPGVWLKDGIRVKPNSTRRVTASGHVHSLTLCSLEMQDTGTIAFQTDSVRCSARLTITEPPVTFLKLLEDQSVPETASAAFECELSRSNAQVTWSKDGDLVKANTNTRIYCVGRKRILQLSQCRCQDSGTYTCDTGFGSSRAQLAVYEREVRIVKELEPVQVREKDSAVFVCELSQEVGGGEWFQNGHRLKPSDTIKIRQEGNKHFLLLYSVQLENAGEIRFAIKQAESVTQLDVDALPVRIVKPLRDKTGLEKHRVILECKLSTARAEVRWYRGDAELQPSDRHQMCADDTYRQLIIHSVTLEDEGTYTCDAYDDHSSAKLLVEEQSLLVVAGLVDVMVRVGEEACFQCELSMPVVRAPQWSVNGETLQSGPRVRLENKGIVQRLVLREVSAGMSGTVKFLAGKARSSARLLVKDD